MKEFVALHTALSALVGALVLGFLGSSAMLYAVYGKNGLSWAVDPLMRVVRWIVPIPEPRPVDVLCRCGKKWSATMGAEGLKIQCASGEIVPAHFDADGVCCGLIDWTEQS